MPRSFVVVIVSIIFSQGFLRKPGFVPCALKFTSSFFLGFGVTRIGFNSVNFLLG